MDTQLNAIRNETAAAVASIDAKVRDKLLKRARKQGMSNEAEVIELVNAWKHSAKKTKRWHPS
jgi:hypothetical protein